MKYGWDKIKVVTDNLNKWDNLQALTFDTCWYLLIWKWDDKYGTQWDPLMSDEVPCWLEANCPICQEKITNVKNLPWRPEPCWDWDSFLGMDRNGNLKAICKSAITDNDEKVKIDSWDQTAWYLWQKLVVCDSDWPISLTQNTSWSFHTMCIWWDPSKADLKFTDLADTPSSLPSPWILVTTWSWIKAYQPSSCSESKYSYIVYNKQTNALDSLCPEDESFVSWYFDWWSCDVPINDEWVRIYATNNNDSSAWRIFNWSWHMSATDDVLTWSWSTLFMLTKPWVYVITCNSTLRNITEAWLQAARWWLLITLAWNELEWTDFKYDWRKYTQYVNDFYPEEYDSDYNGSERNLELSIMSFNTTHVIAFPWASQDNPVWIWFWVRCSTYLNDHRMKWWQALDHITLELTWWQTAIWPKTRITCFRKWDVPPSYKSRF